MQKYITKVSHFTFPTCVSTHDIDAAHAAATAAVDLVAADGGRDAEDELGFEIGEVCLGFVVF